MDGLREDWQGAGEGVEERRFLCLVVPICGFFHPSLKQLVLAAAEMRWMDFESDLVSSLVHSFSQISHPLLVASTWRKGAQHMKQVCVKGI